MSLRELNVRTRRRLRLHGWLLTLWCVALGMATSWFLLRVLYLRAPAARYAISGVLMYSLGLVVGTRFWLARFAASVREEAGQLGTASRSERVGFDDEHREDKTRTGKRIGKQFDWGLNLIDVSDLFSFDELSIFLLVPALILIALAALALCGVLPVMLADGVAALLAEMAVQFVFGALLVRGVMRPQKHDEAFLHIVGKTWIVGLLLALVSAAAGWFLVLLDPGAASIGDLFRH
jgi:hypothetical protein